MPWRQIAVYLLVGVLSAVTDIGLMQLLLWAGSGHVAAVSSGFAAGLVFNYVAHLRYTFSSRHSLATLVRFGVLLALNYGVTLLCVEASLALLDDVLSGKLVSLPLVAANGFVLGRHWVFQPPLTDSLRPATRRGR